MDPRENQALPRRKMELGDWLEALVNVVIGTLLGAAAYNLLQLVGTPFFSSAVFTVLLFSALFIAMLMFEELLDKLFPEGLRPSRKGRDRAPKPFALLLSMPAGAAIGVVIGRLGLAATLLDLLP